MKVLVVDTALGLCTAGVFEVDGDVVRPLGLRSEAMTKGHSERLAGLARDAAKDAGGFDGVDRIGVTVGPGSFTGLRVGMAFALGLGAALGKPVVGLSTLDALAGATGAPDRAALIDARRGQVYARFWKGGEAQGPAEALSIEEAQGRVAELTTPALIGSGSGLVLESAPGATVVDAVGARPEDLARLTVALDPEANPPKPMYLRAPDATPPTRLPGQPRSAASA